jgi:hypothetical protein
MYENLKWLSQIQEASLNVKSRSGSYSGIDAFIQVKKQAQKSHAKVPLIKQWL